MAVPHGKSTRVLLATHHLTGRFNEASTSYSRDVADKTPFGVDEEEYVAGTRDGTVSSAGSSTATRVRSTRNCRRLLGPTIRCRCRGV